MGYNSMFAIGTTYVRYTDESVSFVDNHTFDKTSPNLELVRPQG